MRRVLSCFTVTAMLAWSAPAWAPFHLSVIEQAYFGSADCPDSQYVMIRTLAPLQVFVRDQSVTTQTADGSAGPVFGTFDHNLARTDAGVAMLIGTHAAAQQFGIAFDQEVGGRLIQPDGRVCFGRFNGSPVDCIAYGAFSGDNSPHGDPAVAPQPGQALVRHSETDDNAADFALGAPVPENNAGEIGARGACGGSAATETPTATPLPEPICAGDCNGDGTVAIGELIIAVNLALGGDPNSYRCTALCGSEIPDISCLVRMVNNALGGCPAAATPTATGIPGGTSTATVTPAATNTPGGPLGLRHFSLDPSKSRLIATLAQGFDFPNAGFTGFLDLSAGAPDPSSGIAFVDVVDASEYLALGIPVTGGAICIKPDRSQLPIHNAGIVACKGGAMLGLSLSQDRNVGVAGACSGGTADGLVCTADGDCPAGACFGAEDCSALGGTLEGEEDPFPGVCQGPLDGATLPGDTGPGAVLLSPDPNTGITKGIPVTILQETALPCGDEPNATALTTSIALTTGTARCTILDYNNQPGATLTAQQTGVNFDCSAWSVENGPGTLVLAAPVLNSLAVNQQPTDLITSFVFAD
jgi:hypothetical protein